ncbi:hypothetical protein CGRA01v4_10397 [Colletotrichum graminicola]|uniref:ribonuclease H n=1 Tax=Colletotrichum graminicola (strain M1.001 / M2 / FGSC 10212) TaxID=645133 RepID=E3QDF5_COLGM|nr:uncharacterized protein GLRG_04071 [Colletotrichum graminicola M1.001]EFQ28927.1 hypothetical protein GLRG_04071 [Colletotrichum graminicola M1.001]WDK19110.1 hypothetical protein CGRA01v4_10397 [Colletotrichum graminicola]
MAFDDITRMKLPNGNWVTVCAAHSQVVCGRCCVDFSFDLNDGEFISSDDEGIFGFDASGLLPRDVTFKAVAKSKFGRVPPRRRGKATPTRHAAGAGNDMSMPLGVKDEVRRPNDALPSPCVSGDVFPTLFSCRMKPLDVFPPGQDRFYHQDNDGEVLVFVDGACSGNGTTVAVGGCGFVFNSQEGGSVRFPLEGLGVDGELYPMTSNRAELRAALGALSFRTWHGEGVERLVIATDSEYVATGATLWVRGWVEKGWRSSKGRPVKNRDLWEALLRRVKELRGGGCEVSFWRIPREWNTEADRAAKEAAVAGVPHDNCVDVVGFAVLQ